VDVPRFGGWSAPWLHNTQPFQLASSVGIDTPQSDGNRQQQALFIVNGAVSERIIANALIRADKFRNAGYGGPNPWPSSLWIAVEMGVS
jgi:hypothetical protein